MKHVYRKEQQGVGEKRMSNEPVKLTTHIQRDTYRVGSRYLRRFSVHLYVERYADDRETRRAARLFMEGYLTFRFAHGAELTEVLVVAIRSLMLVLLQWELLLLINNGPTRFEIKKLAHSTLNQV
jgi:hypothetical protein